MSALTPRSTHTPASVRNPHQSPDVATGVGPRGEWLAACERRPWVVLGVLALLLAVQINPWWHPTPDAVMYLSIARSIVRGEHVADLGSRQLGFPPGYPLLISPAFLLGERPFLALSVIHWGLALLLMLGTYRWARQCLPGAALLVTAAVMVNVNLWIAYRRTLSELAFTTVLMWTVVAANAAVVATSARRAAWRTAVTSALLVVLTLIREVGVVLAAGFAVSLVWRGRNHLRRWPATAALLLAVAVPVTLTAYGFTEYERVVRAATPAPVGSHLDGWTDPRVPLAGRYVEILRLRISEIGRLMIPGMFKAYGGPGVWIDLNMAVYLPLLVLLLAGWWKLARHQPDAFICAAPFYLGVYLVWPFEGGTRYMLPLLPVLVACFWRAVEPLGTHRLSLLAVALLAHLVVATGFAVAVEMPRARDCHRLWPVVERLTGPVPPDARVAVTAGVPACMRWMLAFTLDRPVPDDRGAADPAVEWLVVPDAESDHPGFVPPGFVPPGFVPHSRAGAYRLLARRS